MTSSSRTEHFEFAYHGRGLLHGGRAPFLVHLLRRARSEGCRVEERAIRSKQAEDIGGDVERDALGFHLLFLGVALERLAGDVSELPHRGVQLLLFLIRGKRGRWLLRNSDAGQKAQHEAASNRRLSKHRDPLPFISSWRRWHQRPLATDRFSSILAASMSGPA